MTMQNNHLIVETEERNVSLLCIQSDVMDIPFRFVLFYFFFRLVSLSIWI